MQSLNQKCQNRTVLSNWKLTVLLFLSLCNIDAQNDIDLYIPHEHTSESTHPTIELRTIIHVIKYSEEDARNITEDSTRYITQQYDWINSYYRDLRKPTLPTQDGVVHYIPSARVMFKIDKVLFHVDPDGWDRIKTEEMESKPMNFLSYDSSSNSLLLDGNWSSYMNRAEDSLRLYFEDGREEVVRYDKMETKDKTTVFKLKKEYSITESPKYVTCYRELNRNCSLDLWEKYGQNEPNAVHIFYTGSSKSGIAFGCGPTPYYLNVSNIILGGDWAGAQLTAHELGHTIGLSHTDRPQFDDLPAFDKFGFIDCNTSATSNNIMGYNICRNYLSPKQVGYVHRLYSTKRDRILLTTANEYQSNNPIEIWDDTVWEKAMVIKRDLVIRRGQTLEIKNQVHMAEGATIFIEAKAKLVINGAEVTNYFDTPWQGVKFCVSYERKRKLPCKEANVGKVIHLNNGVINNSME